MNTLRLYLASASPRRRALLQQIGIDPVLLPTDLDEQLRKGESPADLVLRLAEAKARRGAELLPQNAAGLVLAADTEVVIDEACLGKPDGPADAAAMLRRLRGRPHDVLTGVVILDVLGGQATGGVDVTRVHFRHFDDATIAAYVARGESSDKAGAYGIQGQGALLVERIEGSWSNVVGLPLERLPTWAAELGIDLWELIAPGPQIR